MPAVDEELTTIGALVDAVHGRAGADDGRTASPDEVRARISWEERLCTAGGILHGGALMALADAAGAYCAFLNLPDGAGGTATMESKTNFFRAVRDGYVEARSRPLHRGRTTIMVETDIFDGGGEARRAGSPKHRLCSRSSGTVPSWCR